MLPLMWWFNTSACELEMTVEGCLTAWASGPELTDLGRPHRSPALSREPFTSELREAEASWKPVDRLMEADESFDRTHAGSGLRGNRHRRRRIST